MVVEGRVLQERWTDQTSNKQRSRLKIRAKKVFTPQDSRQGAAAVEDPVEVETEVVAEGRDVPF